MRPDRCASSPLVSSSRWMRVGDAMLWIVAALLVAHVAAPIPAQTDWSVRIRTGRTHHAMAYDSARGKVVVFGGYDGGLLSDTWEWDGTNWTQRIPTLSPPGRYSHAMVYDAARGRVVLFGGTNFPAFNLSDTWEYDGQTWIQRSPSTSPSARTEHGLAYDAARGKVVLFGGNDSFSDTWEYGPVDPASYVSFGTGCPGSAGVPTLAAAAGQLPWIDTSFMLELTNLPTNAAAALLFGTSNSVFGPVSLPWSLSAIGMPGCTLYGSSEVTVPVANVGGVAVLNVLVSNDPALVGGTVFVQGIVADPPANPLGLTVSNAGQITIGAK